MQNTSENIIPVTVRIAGDIHNGMKDLARKRRVHVSMLYEQSAERFLDAENNPKNSAKNTNGSSVPRR